MNESYDALIVGGGHGGAQAAVALRQYGFDGTVAIVNAEDSVPYQRPPLSKAYLEGTVDLDRILIRPASYWTDHHVDVLQGHRVISVDANAKEVATDQGVVLGYRSLIWATGSRARALECPGQDLAGIHAIRATPDVDRLRTDVARASNVVLVGGGYIGLEAAAVLRKLDKRVTVVEAFDRVLSRVSAEPISRFYQAEHRAHGVALRLASEVAGFEGRDGRLSAVCLADGEVLPCQVAIVGVGAIPVAEPLIAAGADHGNGVLVDSRCRTSLPDVFAIGDCASTSNPYAGGAVLRLESVQNAVDQALNVARTLAGMDPADVPVPSFWSDQYDLRLRTIGLSYGYDAGVVRGDPSTRKFSVVYLRSGRIVAIDSVNTPKDFAQGRALVREAAEVDLEQLVDISRPLADLTRSPRAEERQVARVS